MDKALLLGVNQFKNISGLNGCVNDALDSATFLADQCKFNPDNIRIVLDSRATRSAIMDNLEWLVECKPGDRIYFGMSSHGTQAASRAGSGEVDGLDEVFCPYDFDWDPQYYISDKDFYELFSRMPKGVLFHWSADTCHSGDMTRAIFAAKKPVMVPRYVAPPRDVQWEIDIAKKKSISTTRESKPLEVGFISGCRSDQTSADTFIDGKYCGAMTYFYLKNLKAMMTEPFYKVVESTRNELRAAGYSQEPQAEGSRTNVPFFSKLEDVVTPPPVVPEKKKKKWFIC